MVLTVSMPLALCLPGALLDAAQFVPQHERLTDRIAVEGFDYAAPTFDADGVFTITGAARLVIERVEREPPDRSIVLCGHSLGGMVAQVAVRELVRAPQPRSLGLVLLETSYGPTDGAIGRVLIPVVRAMLAATPWGVLRRSIVRQHGRYSDRARTYLQACLPLAPPPHWRAIVAAALRWNGKDELGAIPMPTLVMVGARNRATHAQGRTMADLIPNAELLTVPDAGHMANLDAPDAVASAISDLVR